MEDPYIDVFDDKHCTIEASMGDGNFQKLSRFPGFSKWIDGTRILRFRPTANNIKYINENWPNAKWSNVAQQHLIEFINNQKAAEDAARMKTEHIEDDGSYIYKTDPFDHQRHCFLLSREIDKFAYFMEQGTGKTKVAIDKAAYNYSIGNIEALVIFAPNGVHSNWIKEEIPLHLPDWCPRETFIYSANMTKTRQKEFEDVIGKPDCLKIFAFNIEGFVSKKAQKLLERINATFPDKVMGAMDESQYCKNPSAERTKYLTKNCRDMKQKLIMTGTNITKGVEDLYAQFNWLGPEILGFDTWTSFKNHFCALGGYQNSQIIGYKNVDELIELIDGWSFRVLKKDCLDLPEKLYRRFTVEMTPKQKKIYDDLRREYIADLDGKTLSAELGVVRLLRLQQVANGWFPADNESDLTRIPGDNPKIESVRQHCKDTDGSVLVWCNGAASTKDIKNFEEILKKDHGNDNVGCYYGEVPEEKRSKNVKAFQDKKMKIMICNRAAARGLTLTACENPIYHSNSFDLEVRLQSEDRCHRIGTKNNVVYTDVQMNCPTEKQIINSLRNKKIIADWVNKDPESFFLEHEA